MNRALTFASLALALTFSPLARAEIAAPAPRVIDVKVTAAGYEPNMIEIAKGEKVQLRLTRTTDATCALEIIIPDAKINKPLPLNKAVVIDLAPLPEGEYKFGCHMNFMLKGLLKVSGKHA